MKNNFDKEKFLSEIHTVPFWVKNGDDLLKFCKHLNYRLLQERAINAWYQDNFKATEEQFDEVNKIQSQYDEAYNTDLSEFRPLEEIFN